MMSSANVFCALPMHTEEPDEFEQRPAYRRAGMYLPALILMGLATAALGYILAMQALGWKAPGAGAFAFGLGKPAAGQQGLLLYVSPNTKSYFAGIGANYDVLIIPWRNYFINRKNSVKEVSDMAQLRDIKQGVLILPSALALSDQERGDIAHFRSQGGAVLATWASGTRNGAGEWQGAQFLESLGARMLGEAPVEPVARHLIVNGESPVSHQNGAGQRIWLGNASEKFLRLKPNVALVAASNPATVPLGVVAARFMNWSRTPDKERSGEGAVIFAEDTLHSGRSAVFAFAESAWESQPDPIYALVDDTLNWLQRKPAIVRAAWPNGKLAAEVIEMDTEQGFPNALRFASMMNGFKYRGTFYVLTSVAKLFPDVLLSLARDAEIGYHGEVHESFKDQTIEQQQKRIDTMRRDMASVIPENHAFTGFRAPYEGYDANTEKVLQKSGFRYHVSDPGHTEARLPTRVKIDGVAKDDALVVLPRTQRDDINLAKENLTAAQTSQALIDDFDLAQDMGGLGLLSVHSQNYGSDGVLTQAMPDFLAHIKSHSQTVWLASAGEVADWWRERDRFKLSATNLGKRVEFNLTVTGKKPFAGGALIVMLPQKDVLPIVKALKVGLPKPGVQKIDPFRALILFAPLQPGDYAYQATFE